MRVACLLVLLLCASGATAQDWPSVNVKKEIYSENANTRNDTADAMARMSDAESLDLLLNVALKDKEVRVAMTACQSLATRAQVAEKEDLKKVVEGLKGALKDNRAEVREAALRGLADLVDWRKDVLYEDITATISRSTDDPDPRVRVAALRTIVALQGADAFSILSSRLEDPEPAVKAEAVRLLGKNGDERAVPALRHALSDDSENVRVEAAIALGSLNIDSSAPYLIGLLRDSSEDVRVRAADSLGKLRALTAVKPLLERLYDPQKDVKRAAIQALGEIGSADAIEPLLQALFFPDKELLNAEISKALSKIGDDSVKPLVSFWRSQHTDIININLHCDVNAKTKSPEIFAILTLRDIQTKASTDALLQELPTSGALQSCILSSLLARNDEKAIEALLFGLQSQDDKVRLEAMKALFSAAKENKSPGLMAIFPIASKTVAEVLLDPNSDMREKALEWFLQVTPEVALPALSSLLGIVKKGAPRDEIIDAIGVLEIIGDPKAEELLVKNLENSDFGIASAASFAVANLNSSTISKKLIGMAKNNKSAGRTQALRAISLRIVRKGEPTSLDEIASLIEDGNFEISFLTARALAASRNQKYVQRLLKFFASSDPRKSALMATLLVWVSPEDAVLPLLQAVQSEDEITRIHAAWSLGQTKDKRASKPLQKALQQAFFKDDKAQKALGLTAMNAAAALGYLGDKEALPTLEVCLSVKNSELRSNCVLSFAKLGGSVDTLLLMAQKDQIAFVRSAAAYGLSERMSEPEAKEALKTIAANNNLKETPELAKKLLLGFKKKPDPLGYTRSSALSEYRYSLILPDQTIKYMVSDYFGDLFEPSIPNNSGSKRDYQYKR